MQQSVLVTVKNLLLFDCSISNDVTCVWKAAGQVGVAQLDTVNTF